MSSPVKISLIPYRCYFNFRFLPPPPNHKRRSSNGKDVRDVKTSRCRWLPYCRTTVASLTLPHGSTVHSSVVPEFCLVIQNLQHVVMQPRKKQTTHKQDTNGIPHHPHQKCLCLQFHKWGRGSCARYTTAYRYTRKHKHSYSCKWILINIVVYTYVFNGITQNYGAAMKRQQSSTNTNTNKPILKEKCVKTKKEKRALRNQSLVIGGNYRKWERLCRRVSF